MIRNRSFLSSVFNFSCVRVGGGAQRTKMFFKMCQSTQVHAGRFCKFKNVTHQSNKLLKQ